MTDGGTWAQKAEAFHGDGEGLGVGGDFPCSVFLLLRIPPIYFVDVSGGEVMKLTDKEIQEAIRQGKKIKRRAWGRCEFVRHIKHAHIPSREPGKFKVEDVEIDDWEVA